METRQLSNLDLFILSYSILVSITFIVLIYLSEVRLDVYVSLYILEYYILRALISPIPEKVSRRLRIVDAAFIIVFSVIVGYRVLEIIAPGLLAELLAVKYSNFDFI